MIRPTPVLKIWKCAFIVVELGFLMNRGGSPLWLIDLMVDKRGGYVGRDDGVTRMLVLKCFVGRGSYAVCLEEVDVG